MYIYCRGCKPNWNFFLLKMVSQSVSRKIHQLHQFWVPSNLGTCNTFRSKNNVFEVLSENWGTASNLLGCSVYLLIVDHSPILPPSTNFDEKSSEEEMTRPNWLCVALSGISLRDATWKIMTRCCNDIRRSHNIHEIDAMTAVCLQFSSRDI